MNDEAEFLHNRVKGMLEEGIQAFLIKVTISAAFTCKRFGSPLDVAIEITDIVYNAHDKFQREFPTKMLGIHHIIEVLMNHYASRVPEAQSKLVRLLTEDLREKSEYVDRLINSSNN